MAGASRPLSPHLSIYRFTMTMAMSIAHRITGAGLYAGTAFLALWLLSVATGGAFYGVTSAILSSLIGQVLLFLYSWAAIHHALGGIRFLILDTGATFGRPTRDQAAWAVLIGSVALTIILWAVILMSRGG